MHEFYSVILEYCPLNIIIQLEHFRKNVLSEVTEQHSHINSPWALYIFG